MSSDVSPSRSTEIFDKESQSTNRLRTVRKPRVSSSESSSRRKIRKLVSGLNGRSKNSMIHVAVADVSSSSRARSLSSIQSQYARPRFVPQRSSENTSARFRGCGYRRSTSCSEAAFGHQVQSGTDSTWYSSDSSFAVNSSRPSSSIEFSTTNCNPSSIAASA